MRKDLASLFPQELIIRETAEIMLELHSLEVPQRIGTTLIHDNVVDLTPFTTIPFNAATSRVYDTLEEYIYALIDARLATAFVGAGDADRSRAAVVLDRLREELTPVLHRLSGSLYRRCVLSHDDMHAGNILIDDAGHISGLVDWEFHSTKPIVLAVDYPSWIVYDGMSDPRFAQEGTWWLVSPEEADKLRTSYAEASHDVYHDPAFADIRPCRLSEQKTKIIGVLLLMERCSDGSKIG